ncbi:MAG: hypothetical protein PHH11_05290 [Methylomonas sp.]|nr:hypothetical protein [Methylomonas sp.]
MTEYIEIDSGKSVFIGYQPPANMEEAYDWIDATSKIGNDCENVNQRLRYCIHMLIKHKVHEMANHTEESMLNQIRNKSKLHKSTIHDYANTATVELVLKIEQGIVSVDAATHLYHNADQSIWKCIFDIVQLKKKLNLFEKNKKKRKRHSRFGYKEPNPYFSKSDIIKAIAQYNKNLKEELEDQSTFDSLDTEKSPSSTPTMPKKSTLNKSSSFWDDDDLDPRSDKFDIDSFQNTNAPIYNDDDFFYDKEFFTEKGRAEKFKRIEEAFQYIEEKSLKKVEEILKYLKKPNLYQALAYDILLNTKKSHRERVIIKFEKLIKEKRQQTNKKSLSKPS